MCTKMSFPHFFLIALSVAWLSAPPAYCQAPSPDPSATPAPEKPSNPNNELFNKFRTQCETQVSCGKGSGDVCAEAAAILAGNEPPEEFFNLGEPQRIKIALRLLERGVDTSNLAAGRAYDYYSKTDLLFFGSFGGFSDPYRANELMDLMIKRGYPGGPLRKARDAVAFFSITATEPQKQEGCALAKRLLAEGKLDGDSTKIANEVLESSSCKNLVEDKK